MRPPPFFIAGNLGLDFLNTLAVPLDRKVEWLGSGEDLLAWMKQADLVPSAALSALRRNASSAELDATAAKARALRNWFKRFVYRHMGKPLPAHALRQLSRLNQLLARDEEFGQIVIRQTQGRPRDGAPNLAWRRQRRWRSPDSLLFPLARALADLVSTENFRDLKSCEGPACTLLFIDRTRGHARRWCSMEVCGNRAKQATHRTRVKQAGKRKRSAR
jgi:predicted RNA-binding Zn ribbon-like protein